jgi:osomolarity two-component system sensor histidine kinase NIK1
MDQLQIFSSEVSRVAREVGTEGILGGQAQISGVDGTWKELTDNGRFSELSLRQHRHTRMYTERIHR